MKYPNLHRDAFNLKDAADYLGVGEYRVLNAVRDDALRVGMIARDWIGLASPDDPEMLGKGWNCIVEKRLDDGCQQLRYMHPTTGEVVRIREFAVGAHFWFLDDPSKIHAIDETPDLKAIFLKSPDGMKNFWLKEECCPWDDFTVWVFKDRNEGNSIQLRKDALLFLRQDLDALRQRGGDDGGDPVQQTRRSELLGLIRHVYEAMGRPKYNLPIWNELKTHDSAGIIRQITASEIIWVSQYGEEQAMTWHSFQNRMSEIRKEAKASR